MDKSHLQVSFFVNSIHLYDKTIAQIKPNNMIKLSITQKPLQLKQEYIVNQLQGLNDINHEFQIIDTSKSMKEVVLSIRKVEKKWCLENLFKINLKKYIYNNNNTTNTYGGKPIEMNDSNIQYKYEQLANSLLGICKINIENLGNGVNNSIKADIVTKKDSKVIGYANIDVYKWNERLKVRLHSHSTGDISSNRVFEDSDYILFDEY